MSSKMDGTTKSVLALADDRNSTVDAAVGIKPDGGMAKGLPMDSDNIGAIRPKT